MKREQGGISLSHMPPLKITFLKYISVSYGFVYISWQSGKLDSKRSNSARHPGAVCIQMETCSTQTKYRPNSTWSHFMRSALCTEKNQTFMKFCFWLKNVLNTPWRRLWSHYVINIYKNNVHLSLLLSLE